MSTYKFSVNVVVRHQSRRPHEIALALGWTPHNAWSSGDRRITPTGRILPGIRQETMCIFRFEFDEKAAASAVSEKVEQLLAKRSYLSELVESGGSVALNLGLNGKFNASFDLSPDALRALGELGIGLSVECFPEGSP